MNLIINEMNEVPFVKAPIVVKNPNFKSAAHRRSVEFYQSLLTSRNTAIDSFEFEFNRHVKLICKKIDHKTLPVGHELRIKLKESLKKSRNMKKIQAEMVSIKNLMKQAQLECQTHKLQGLYNKIL